MTASQNGRRASFATISSLLARVSPIRLLYGTVLSLAFFIMLGPVVLVAWSAFFDSSFLTFPPPGYTLKWFAQAASHDAFWSGFLTSLQVAAAAASIGVLCGLAASLVIVRGGVPGAKVLQAFLLAPMVVPNIVLGIALYVFFIFVADSIGLDWSTGIVGLVSAHTLVTVPWSIRLISANLDGRDGGAEEAAANLGASPLIVFWRVTLPMMRSGIIAAALFSFIVSFENLEISLLLVEPGTTTFPIALLQYLEFKMDPTVAAASTVQIAIIGALLLLTDRYVKLSRIV